jgi:hypothetical protein
LALDGTGATAAPEGLGRMMRKRLLGGLVAVLTCSIGADGLPPWDPKDTRAPT